MKKILISSFIILCSINSFALNVKEAKKLTKQSIISINMERITESINLGYCVSDAYNISSDDEIAKYFTKLGFTVDLNYKKDGIAISWCD
jgi:hypothetical protein